MPFLVESSESGSLGQVERFEKLITGLGPELDRIREPGEVGEVKLESFASRD
jgi:hypothetical protein